MNNVCVLGAGASGMVAAICAARRGKNVTIIDRMNKVGKKIYATGNGKCNFTNEVYSKVETISGTLDGLSDDVRKTNAYIKRGYLGVDKETKKVEFLR